MTPILKAVWAKLRREPVAFYGGLISALLVILDRCGVSASDLTLIVTVCTLVGIPVTRSVTSPAVKPSPTNVVHVHVQATDKGAADVIDKMRRGKNDAGAGELRQILIIAAGIIVGVVLLAWIF